MQIPSPALITLGLTAEPSPGSAPAAGGAGRGRPGRAARRGVGCLCEFCDPPGGRPG